MASTSAAIESSPSSSVSDTNSATPASRSQSTWVEPEKKFGDEWSCFWRSSNKFKGRYQAKCKHCLCIMSGRPSRIHKHIAINCKKIDPNSKAQYIMRANPEAQASLSSKRPRMDSIGETSSAGGKSGSSQLSLSNFFHPPMSEASTMKHHRNLLNALISCNIPFNIVNDRYMKKFIDDLPGNYQLPSRDVLSENVFTSAATQHFIERLDKIKDMKDVTICLDGWEDVSHNSVYGFMLLKNQSEMILDIIDFSGTRPTSDNLKAKLYEILGANLVAVSSVIAIVTDNPTTMVRHFYNFNHF